MTDTENSQENPVDETPPVPTEKPELFSKEFYIQFAEKSDHVTWNLFYKIGLFIDDEGKHKFKRPIYKAVIEEALEMLHNGMIDIDKVREYAEGLSTDKITRYSMEVEMAKIKRKARKG